LIQSTDLSFALNKTLDFIRTECKAMLYVVERINREYGTHFDFIIHSIMPELMLCLQQTSNDLFFAADPERFHERYSAWLSFVEQTKALLSKTSENNLVRSSVYQQFSSQWDLVVYYQIRFQDIATNIETVLVEQPWTLLGVEPTATYRTLIAFTVFQSIERCWHVNVFLEPLADQFWKLTLQCLVRFRTWIETIDCQTKTNERQRFLLNLYVDLDTLAKQTEQFFRTVIINERLTSMIGLTESLSTGCSDSTVVVSYRLISICL
jgi:conserved oligomeric Golgi complex subunit 2